MTAYTTYKEKFCEKFWAFLMQVFAGLLMVQLAFGSVVPAIALADSAPVSTAEAPASAPGPSGSTGTAQAANNATSPASSPAQASQSSPSQPALSTSSSAPSSTQSAGDSQQNSGSGASSPGVSMSTANSTPATLPAGSSQPSGETAANTASTATASSTGSQPSQNTAAGGASASSSLAVNTGNAAAASTSAAVSAGTGSNAASSTDTAATSTVHTGNAVATANVVTVVNTNSVGGGGSVAIANNTTNGDVDLRPLPFFASSTSSTSSPQTAGAASSVQATSTGSVQATSTGSGQATSTGSGQATSSCLAGTCGSGGALAIANTNTATATNAVSVSANTGGNSATEGAGASIDTGNAYAAANIITIANTNFIGTRYFLFILNQFFNWHGDFILPNKDTFRSMFLSAAGAAFSGDATIAADNNAHVSNNVSVAADTGNNAAQGSETAIATGNSHAFSNVLNLVNTNTIEGNPFALFFHISGLWSGSIFNLPDGVSAEQVPGGLILYPTLHVATGTVPLPFGLSQLSIFGTNTAYIANTVRVSASTGGNDAASSGYAAVTTGNAYAAANIITIANTNVVGRNWLLGIIDVLGDWSGNISFGRPDLWIGGKATFPANPPGPGMTIRYCYTVMNSGDADATHVRVEDHFNPKFLTPLDAVSGGTIDDPFVALETPSLSSGTSTMLCYSAMIKNDLPTGGTAIVNTAHVSNDQADGTPEDNTDVVRVQAINNPNNGAPTSALMPPPHIIISKTVDRVSAIILPVQSGASSAVHYMIDVKNTGIGPAFGAVLRDELDGPSGTPIHRKSWKLGDLKPGAELQVNYDAIFSTSTRPGVYVNKARVQAFSGSPITSPFLGWFAESNVATATVTISGPAIATAEAVSASTSTESIVSPLGTLPGLPSSRDVIHASSTSPLARISSLSSFLPLLQSRQSYIESRHNGPAAHHLNQDSTYMPQILLDLGHLPTIEMVPTSSLIQAIIKRSAASVWLSFNFPLHFTHDSKTPIMRYSTVGNLFEI